MRKRNGVILAVIGYIVFFLCIEGWGADWTFYDQTKYATWFYDAESIKEVSKGVLRVWEKSIISPEGVEDRVKDLGPKAKNLSHELALLEIDCTERKYRLLSLTAYDKDGISINSSTFPDPNWVFIVPESQGENSLKAVCPKRKR